MPDLELDIEWDGKPISQPGIYKGVPMGLYHRQLTIGPSISSGGLRKIENKSPLHFWHDSYLNPEAEPLEENEAMILGRAVHAILLGQSEYDERFVIRPAKLDGEPWHGNRTVCKEWLAARAAENQTVITPAQRDTIKGIAARIGGDPILADMLRGRIERSMVVRDPRTGVWLKSRPDAIPLDREIVDLKTTGDASPRGITRAIMDQGYLQQMALAVTCFEKITGEQVKGATLLFVETKPPYAYSVRPLDSNDLYRGMMLNRRAIDTFARCLREGDFPTYESSFTAWSAPTYWQDMLDKDPTVPDLKGETL